MRAPPLVVAFTIACSAAGCAAEGTPAADTPPLVVAPPRCTPEPLRQALDAFRRAQRSRYQRAIAKARGFLDRLDVNPIALRAAHLKGKKKLVEALDAYRQLEAIAAPEERPAIRARIEELARVTLDARYHDMQIVDDRTFHEDATSYLRAAVLLDRLGFDTRLYRDAIRAVKPRLDAHLQERGPHQRRAFHAYYEYLGLAEPFPLGDALADGLIAKRADPLSLSRADAYALTHEIYAAYDFGDQLDADPFPDAARLYLRGALPALVGTAEARKDPDLVAELATCLRYVRFTGDPSYCEALRFLLDAQNEDGSWGHYEAARARMGALVEPALYLHTTMVAIEALALGFDERYRRGEAPACP